MLLLDVMSTLVVDPFYDAVPAFFGMTLDELIACKHPQAWVRFERGEIGEDEMLASFFADGRSYDHAGLVSTLRDGYAWLPGIESLLGELAAAGVEMHTLSNYPRWHELIEARLSLSRWVAWTFVSCKTGLRKPDVAVYRHALAALGIAARDAVFVDDRHDNCQSARGVGIASERFVDAATLRAALVGRGWLARP